MFLRAENGLRYVNSDNIARVDIQANGSNFDIVEAGSGSVLKSGFSTQAAGLAAWAEVASIIRTAPKVNVFVSKADGTGSIGLASGDVVVNVSNNVAINGQGLLTGFGSQAAAVAAMDALMQTVGALDVAALL